MADRRSPTAGARWHLPEPLRRPVAWDLALTSLFFLALSLPAFTFFGNPADYLPLHMSLEFVSMAVSAMVFALAWNLRRVERNSHIMVLGSASLAIALIDFMHTLSFPGMPDFVTASGTEKAINFWLAGRLVAALAFLFVAAFRPRHWPTWVWYPLIAGTAVIVGVVWWVGLARPDLLPRSFIPGQGLTTAKVASEYVIAGIYAVSALLLFRRAHRESSADTAWLASASWILVLAELFFTLYATATDVFNLLGHVYKVVAYLMVYRALFVAGVQEPYRQLDREQSLLRSLIDSIPDLIFIKDRNDVYVGSNTAFTAYSGMAPEELVGRTDLDLVDGDTGAGYRSVDARVLATGQPERTEEWVPFKGGGGGTFDTLKTPYYGPDGESLGLIGISRDITEQRLAEQRIRQLAELDQLTGLPNQAQVVARVRDAADPADGEPTSFALLHLDIDDFRTINDTIGHSVGDALLRLLGARLQAAVGDGNTVARIGGDDFLLLLAATSPDEAERIGRDLLSTVNAPFQVDDYELIITVSIGVACFPADGRTFEELFRCADTATNRAKQEGRNAVRRYRAEMHSRSAHRLTLLSSLRRAVDNDELRLHYQPQLLLREDRLCGVEALVRWQHPELGLIPPGEFIELAEDSGLIVPIGDWVLRRAMSDAVEWAAAGVRLDSLAVNVSAAEFRLSDLPERVATALADTGFPAQNLDLELTETIAMRDAESAVAIIDQLHGIGVRVSLDDFGTGYSSLAYLKRFRIDRLKIDRSFVADIGADAEDGAIVRAILDMARSLDCGTVAEGVETRSQLEFLRTEGCEVAQGFFIARPVPADEILGLLQRGYSPGIGQGTGQAEPGTTSEALAR